VSRRRRKAFTAQHHRLFFEEYSAADPFDDELDAAITAAHHALFPGHYGPVETWPKKSLEDPITLTRGQVQLLETASATWVHYGAHPADDKSILTQLGEVRRFARNVEIARVRENDPRGLLKAAVDQANAELGKDADALRLAERARQIVEKWQRREAAKST
jgi:hypothetical protein